MLMQTIASSQYEKDIEGEDEKDESDVEEDIPPLNLSETDLQNILGGKKAP